MAEPEDNKQFPGVKHQTGGGWGIQTTLSSLAVWSPLIGIRVAFMRRKDLLGVSSMSSYFMHPYAIMSGPGVAITVVRPLREYNYILINRQCIPKT